jgi:hypothetical protein
LVVAERRNAALTASAAGMLQTLATAAESAAAAAVHAAAAARHREAEAFHLTVAHSAESHADLLDQWVADPDPQADRPRMVALAADPLGTDSVAATLHGGGHGPARLSASDTTSRAACEAESLAAQGPLTQAWSSGKPCIAAGPELRARWPMFAQVTAELRVGSVVAAPLGYPSAAFGAVCGYYRDPAAINDAAIAAAARVGAVLTRLILHIARTVNPRSLLIEDSKLAVVLQATGMVSVQAGCDVDDARDLLAARAFADGITLAKVAEDVVSGAVRFAPVP